MDNYARAFSSVFSRSYPAMKLIRCFPCLMVAIGLAGCQTPTLYFVDRSQIKCMPATGGVPKTLRDIPALSGLVYGEKDDVLYVSQMRGISRWGFESTLTPIIETRNATCLALDEAAGRVYWGDQDAHHVASCVLNGQGKKVLVRRVNSPDAVAVSPALGWLFWSQDSPDRGVWRARLDGTQAHQITYEAMPVTAVSVDESRRRIYWVRPAFEGNVSQIVSADFDGKHVTLIARNLPQYVKALTVNPKESRVYWAEREKGIAAHPRLRRMKADGTGGTATVLQFDYPAEPTAITVGPHLSSSKTKQER